MNSMIRTLTTDEIDFVAGAGGYCAVPSSVTSLSVYVSKTVTKTTNIASGNTATQTATASGASYINQGQATGNFSINSAIIVLA
jgi:hypothetical protein